MQCALPCPLLGFAEEGSEGSGCPGTAENVPAFTAQVHALQGCPPECSVPHWDLCSDAGSKWCCLCWEMWIGREQAISRGQCLITWGPWKVIFYGWRNWIFILVCVCVRACMLPAQVHSRMTCRSRRHNYMEMALVWELPKTLLRTLGVMKRREFWVFPN